MPQQITKLLQLKVEKMKRIMMAGEKTGEEIKTAKLKKPAKKSRAK